MNFTGALGAVVITAFISLAPAHAQSAGAGLRITYQGLTTTFSIEQIAALPHQTITAFDAHQKKNHDYSGVPVQALLAKVGVAFGEKLRGAAMRQVVVVRTHDHYDVAFALAEFDPAFRPNAILLVDREDGATMGEGAGPLRLVAPGDLRPARWARMIESIDIVSVGEGRS